MQFKSNLYILAALFFCSTTLTSGGVVKHKEAFTKLEEAKRTGNQEAIAKAEKEVKKQKDIVIAGNLFLQKKLDQKKLNQKKLEAFSNAIKSFSSF